MNSREYWRERALILNDHLMQPADELLPDIENAYELAIYNIETEINSFYQRFATDNQLTFQEATKKLTSAERKSFKMSIEEYIKKAEENELDGKWVKQLQNASTLQSIDRLRALRLQMRQQVEVLEAYKAKSLTKTLGELYQEGYYRTAYEIQKGLGVGAPFATLDVNKINKVLAQPWSPDGETFSEKIWGKDRRNLIHQLNTRFTQGVIRGENPREIIGSMAKSLNASKEVTSRLVLTEASAFASISTEDSYNASNLEEFEYVAALDEVTCDTCGAMDGQHFPMAQYTIGEFVPPLHPWCRCTTAPYFNDEFTQEETRAARGEDGKTYYVPSDITYKDWYNEYVLKSSDYSNTLIGLETVNGIEIKGIKQHLLERASERSVSVSGIKEALTKPLKLDDVKTNEVGKLSQRFIGEGATVNINPETGHIITAWVTGKNTVKKYKK